MTHKPDRLLSTATVARETLLTVKDVATRCGVSVKTVRRWSEDLAHFPKPGKLGNVVRWRESEVNTFVENFGR